MSTALFDPKGKDSGCNVKAVYLGGFLAFLQGIAKGGNSERNMESNSRL